MKKILILITMLFCIYSYGTPVILSFSITPVKEEVSKTLNQNVFLAGLDISKMSVKDFEKLSGKKLTLKEKIGFKILQQKLKKDPAFFEKVNASSKGKTALILGIIGLAVLFIPYLFIASIPLAILAIVMGNKAVKENPEDKKGKTARILGWVTLGLVLVLLLTALLIVLAFAGVFGG